MGRTLLKRPALLLAAAAAFVMLGITPLGPTTSTVVAAEASVPAGDTAILPYLDDDTFIVARLDVEKVDQDELRKLFEKALDAMFKKLAVPPRRDRSGKSAFDAGGWAGQTMAYRPGPGGRKARLHPDGHEHRQ
jgi:hypothetical protein